VNDDTVVAMIKCFAPLNVGHVQTANTDSVMRPAVWLKNIFCALVSIIASVIWTTSPQ